ncbi:MAG TPA: hypothetical protein VEA16_22110 [Vicinamibacterales bacterium]|nr:hypothetical protein [Vicinamibacterales bacterium]
MLDQRRPLLRLGATLLLVSAGFGLAAAIPLPNPARWMTAHVTAIMLGTLLMVYGLVWRDLRLSDRQRTWLVRLVYLSVWSGVALGIAAAILDIPGPASSPGITPTGIQVPVLGTLLGIIVPTTVASWVLLLMGLRGNEV